MNTNGYTDPAFALSRVTSSFTFSLGLTVQLLRVSPTLFMDIRRAVRQRTPPPPIPINIVDMGSGPVEQENPLDPAYERALKAYEEQVQSEALDLYVDALIEEAVIIDMDESEMNAAVQAREAVLARVGVAVTLSGATPKARYLRHVASTGQELDQMLAIVTGRSQPQEAQVQAHVATFPGAVQEPAD